MSNRPWLSVYPPGVPADVEMPDKPLPGILDEAVARFGDHVALEFLGATTTYRELAAAVARAAEALRELGVAPGDRVALVLPNCPQHVVAFYAALRIGAVVVEHNPLYTADELAHQLADHGARVVVCWQKTASTIDELRSRTSVETILAVDLIAAIPMVKRLALALPVPSLRRRREALRGPLPPGALQWDSVVARSAELPADVPGPTVDDLALLQYTGGTTGTPKGAMLTHRNLAVNAAQGRAWVPEIRYGEENVYAVMPLFHAYGLTLCLTFAISVGACLVLLPRFDVDDVLAAAKRRPPTFLPGVPPIYQRLAAAARERGADLTSVRYAISGAMALPPDTVEEWESVTGGLLVEGYGMTETSPITVGNPMSEARRPGMIGVPLPSTYIRVADPDDATKDRAPGEAGELLVKGPQVFSGYWNQPEETAAVLLEGGWLRTGDIVVVDDDGFVRIVDRIKELIITGGFNVYPSEVEDAVRQHPDVEDVAAVGLPGRGDGGEQVTVAVTARPGRTIDPDELRRWARERMTGYKAPRQVIVVDELPRNAVGKLLRRAVREQIREG